MKSLAKLAFWSALGCALFLGGGSKAQAQTTAVRLNCVPAYGPSYVGKAYSSTCTGTGGSSAYTFALGSTGGGIPAGVTLTVTSDTTARVSGTPTTTGPYGFGVTITDDRYSTVSAFGFSGTVNAAPVFSCASASGPTTVGYSYSDICSVPTGQTPLTWSITSGSLPAGVTLTPSGTQVTVGGTPTTAGSYAYLLQATDVNGTALGNQFFSGTVSAPATFSCGSNAGPTSTTAAYSDTCTASGGSGSYSWAITSGTLPTGVGLTASGGTATIKSTPPIAAGLYSYTLTLTDVTRNTTANQTFSGTVIAPLTITCDSPNGPVFTGYTYGDNCSASGGSGTYSWSISSSSLPGLTVSPTSGATTKISVTPTTTGSYYYGLQLSDSLSNYASQYFSGTLVAPPTITSLNPNNALVNAAGFTLTVNGSNLASNAVIYFNGTALTTTHYTTTNMLTAPVPASLLTSPGVYQVVINEGGTFASNSPANFTVAPVLTSINPTSTGAGSAQFTLTATGAGFLNNSGTSVQWNGTTLATSFSGSTTSITATVPANLVASPGTAQITVTAGGVVSSPQTFTIQAVPTLTAVNPSSVTAGGAQFNLTATGTNFVSNALVRWNGANLTTTYVSATQLTAIVPASLIASAGTAQVSVSSNGFVTGNQPVTINSATTITSLSPASAVAGGQAFSLTINGTNLNSNDGAAAASFNGTPLTITSASATQIVANVPANLIATAGNYTVAVQGNGNPTATFTVLPAPTLTSISPTSATAGGTAFTLTVTGSNFTAATAVQWNGQALTTTYVGPTQLTAAVPATLIATAGTAQVTAVLGGVSSAAQTFTISGAPTLTQINPSVVAAGGTQFVLTATGTNFGSGAVVRWNGQNLATVYNSATQLTATVPATLIATAGTAQVLVNNAGVNTGSQTVTIYQIPTITLSPTSATAGSSGVTLTVTGSSAFLTPATVYWNATPLTTTVVSPTVLTATVPATLLASAGTAQVTVASSGLSTPAATFTITQPAPTLTAINPTSATAGGAAFTLTATGTNFTSGSVVQWNGQSLVTTFGSATSLSAAVPATLIANAGTAQVTVLTGNASTAAQTFTINAPAPTLTGIAPTSATAGGAAFTLTATGTNFTSGSVVQWNGQSLTTTFVNATSLTAAVPATLIATAGTAQVTVLTGTASTGPQTFTINAPAATLTSINPTSATAGGAAFTLTATGTNFTSGSAVQWNGQSLTTTFVSATQLTAAVPATLIATAGTARVTVLTGTASTAAQTFTINAPAATLASINPTSATAGGAAFTLTATGTNFTSSSVVQWNGQSLVTTFVSATSLTAAVPATLIATAGTAQVTVLTGTASTAAQTFTINAPAATLTSINPTSATAGGAAFTLTATGTNFTPGSIVQWNGQSLVTTFVSATSLTAAVPATLIASAGTAQVTVLTGTASTAAQTFTINAPAATLTSISPTSATAGGPAFTLTATGTNFTSGSVVQWNGQSLVTTFIGATSLTSAVPATLIATAGTAQVTVLTGTASTAAQIFTIQAASTLTSINPTSATAGGASFNLTATGTNFTSSSVLRWNGQNLSTALLSATQVTAAISTTLIASAGTAQVSVLTGGVATGNVPFTILAAPGITSLSPNSTTAGSTGFTLTVAGANFTSGTSVLWNGTALTSTFVSAIQLTASVPASLVATAGTAAVSVSQGGVISPSVSFNITSAPTLSSLSPNTATVNSGQFTLTVNGGGFASGAMVLWNGAALTTSFVSAGQLTAVVPASLLTTTGTFPITVTSGGVTTVTSLPFNVVAAPTITSLNPNSTAVGGGPFLLTVTGSGFTSGSTIQWNGGSLTTTFVTATQLTTTVPATLIATVGTNQVSVLTSSISSNSLPFSVAATPTLTSLTPTQAAAYGPAFTLTVNGTGFASGATILLNGNALTTTFVSTTQLTAAIPADYITTVGSLPVRVTSAGINSSNSLTLQTVAQTLTQLSPSSASAGGPDFTLTVTGTGFGPSNTVIYWNGETALQTTVLSATQASATVPASLIATAGTARVTLVSSDGAATNPLTFTINAGPTLASINPSTATAGSADLPVTVTGTGFGSDAVVGFGAINLATTFVSSTQLTATIPAAQLSSPATFLVVVSTGGVQTTQLLFRVVTAPTLTSLSPNPVTAGAAGFLLTVNGTGFASTATVLWNNASLATTYVSATQLTATVPASLIAGPGTAQVAVQSNGVTTGSLPVVINAPTPVITINSLSPSSAVAGGSTFTLTITGTNVGVINSFASFNGTVLTTLSGNATQLTVNVPAALIANAGTYSIQVSASGYITGSASFNVTAPLPTLTSLIPSSATAGSGAFTLTVNGTGFSAGAVALWNGAALTTTFVNATQLTAAVPASLLTTAGTFPITVTSGGVAIAGSLPFNVLAAPTVTSLNPNTTAVGGAAFPLTVNGSGFTATSAIQWNGASLPTTFLSATQLRTTVPASLISALSTAQVSVANGSVSSNTLPFAVVATPTLTSLSPNQTTAGSAAFTLTVNGSGFASGATVNWNDGESSIPLTTTFVSPTQLTAAVPASYLTNIGTFYVGVTSSGVDSANTLNFRVVSQTLTSLSPNSAIAGGPAFTLTVNGAGFGSDATVYWGETSLATTFVNSTQVTAAVTADLIASPGTAQVTVASNDSESSNSLPFTIAAGPSLSSLSPTTTTAGGAAFTLTVNGSGFGSDAVAFWNGSALTTAVLSATQLTAAVPASLITNVGSFPITVTSGGVTTTSLPFTVVAAPTVTALNPAGVIAGSAGFNLTVTGTGFSSTDTVLWNGTSLQTTYVSATQLIAAVPASLLVPGTPQVAVLSNGAATNSLPFTIAAPAITVTSLNPSSAVAGGPAFPLTISGTNLNVSNAAVYFNGTQVAIISTSNSATSYTLSVPAAFITNPGIYSVQVQAPGYTPGSLSFTVLPAPAVTSISPNTITAGSTGFPMTITGANFTSGTSVLWNGAALASTFNSATQITANVPASLVAVAGPAAVSASLGGVTSPSVGFTITAAPTLTSLSPASATVNTGAFTLTVNGSGFTSGATVLWNGAALNTAFVNTTQLTAAVPASLLTTANSFPITVVSGGVATATPLQFAVLAAPTVTLLSPNTTAVGGAAFPLTVNGSGFTANSAIQWNGSPLATTFVSATQLRTTVAASLISAIGIEQVSVANGSVSSNALPFSVAATPTLTSLSPTQTTVGSAGFTLTVNGSGFASGATVNWNDGESSIPLTSTFVSPAQLTAAVPARYLTGTGTFSISVTSSGINSGNTLDFQVVAQSLTSLSPNTATAGGTGFTLTVNGAGFGPDAAVVWGESSLPTTFINSTQVTAAIPASLIANPGTAQVSVFSNDYQSSNSLPFTIVAGPTLSSLSPNAATAGGTAFTLTVNGTGFGSDATVLWNGAALVTNVVSATQLTAAVPASQITTAGTFPITVVSGGVATLTSLPFTVSAAPVLSAITPNTATAGSAGFPVTLTGTGFTSSTTAFWNNTALTITSSSATQITVAIPASLVALSGINQVSVSAGGVSSNSLPFTVTPAASLTSLSPSTGTTGGTAFTLTVNGSGFGSDATVLWNNTPLTTTYVSAIQVTANVPANLLTTTAAVPVTVVTGGVTSVNFLYFTIIPGAATSLTSISPNAATVGGAAFILTVNGAGFNSGATVLWNGAALTTTFVNATQLTAAVPASQITTAGTFPITVVSGGVATLTSLPFTVSAAPALTSISPNSTIASAGNFTLTANGSGFNSSAIVNWNGSPLTTTFVSATQLTAAVPAGLTISAGTSVVTVSQGSVSSNGLNFTTAAAPAFVSISPTSVTAGGAAFTLTVNGSGFAANASVLWNGAAMPTTFVSATQLQAAVPASLIVTPGPFLITVISGNATLGPLTLTVVAGPAISALSPNAATAGGSAFTLTVTGTGFGPNSSSGATVQWNGSALATTFVSATQLTAAVPANLIASAGTASVTVAAGNVTSNSLTFTVAATQSVIAPVSLTGLPASAPAGSTQTVGVQLGNAAPVALTGTLQLGFAPSVTGLPAGYIDPHVVFASGSTTSVNFTIPAGGTVAAIPQGGAISLGTVAGTISVTLTSLTANGVNVLPSATVTSTVVVQATAPVITDGSVKITNVTTNGFTVQLTGYSTTREVSIADFIFTAANGSQLLGSTEFTVPVAAPFATWFSSAQGQSYGSQFSLQVPFTISGSTTSVVQGVSVTLRNSAGTSSAVSGSK